ncbi:hypothetical protein [Streptomyces sp. NPDC020681]|uniref:hypothetical protein n=1 Tax=Streptomyces sp. NPDC020681 TaxID=3365083 RepID=UPI0037B85A76
MCRDRAPFFAEGATAGAPQAVQVADRWHLWHNLSEAAERSIAQHRRCLRVLVPETPETPETPARPRGGAVRLALADRSPVRRPRPNRSRHGPCSGGGRAQPSRDPAAARHDEPNR